MDMASANNGLQHLDPSAVTMTGKIVESQAGYLAGGRTMSKKTRSEGDVSPSGQPDAVPDIPGQVVLVFQGGGALGAYQAGVYQALHDAHVEPDWVIGP